MKRMTCKLLAGAVVAGAIWSAGVVQVSAADYWTLEHARYDRAFYPTYSPSYYRTWEPGPYSSRVAPYPGEGSVYYSGPAGGRVYGTPPQTGTIRLSPITPRYGFAWW